MSGRRRRFLVGVSGAAAFLLVVSFALAEALRTATGQAPVAVDATPISAFDIREPERVRFGALSFRGGLVLTSSNPAFGGISALHMEADGAHFIAVTDNGSWLKARIVYKDGRPSGCADAEMAPMLGPDGSPLAKKGWFDAESLTERDGMFYVGFERVERIVRFDLRKHGLAAHGEPIPVPAGFKTFKFNKSLECIAAPPKGSMLAGKIIVVTERSLDSAGNHRAFLLGDGKVARFSVKRSGDFDVSDCAILPPKDLLLLERSYTPLKGVAMRILRIPLSALEDGAVVDGKPLITADMGFQIDNMEGLGVHRAPDGETVLTLISDDNFSFVQRTILLQFTVAGE
jgi:hypothetical protein